MQIHRVRGHDFDDALRRARSELGEGAVVLSREAEPGGAVTLAVADTSVDARRRARSGPSFQDLGEERDPGLDELARRLREVGFSDVFADRVAASVERSGNRGMYALDAAARMIGRLFPITPSPKRAGRTQVVAAVGPTGVGKTTSLAKLGLRLVRAGRRVAFATLDTWRVAAVEQLRTYAELLECPLHSCRTGSEVAAALGRERGAEVMLVDTTGRSPKDTTNLSLLRDDLAHAGLSASLETYLVMSATSAVGGIDAVCRAFGSMEPTGIVLTKLDETERPGATLERLLRRRLPLAFLCDGQDVTGHLHRPRPDHLADLALRGRIV